MAKNIKDPSMLNMSLGFFGSIEPSLEMSYFHRHNEIEINYSPNFSFEYLLNGEMVFVPKRTLFVFWALKPHSIIWAESKDSMHYHVTIPLSWVLDWKLPRNFIHDILKGKPFIESEQNNSIFDEHLIQTWCHNLKTSIPELHQATICEVQARLLRLAYTTNDSKCGYTDIYDYPDNSIEKVAKITAFIAERASEPLQVADVAKFVGLSPSYATTIFKETCGISIMKFIIEHKISLAQILLVSTDKKITTIAYESGFGSSSQFYEHFTTICGISPSKYRTEVQKNHLSHLANHRNGISANLK